jgi:hypothetical protein
MSAITSADRIGNGGTGASIEVPTSFQPDQDTVLINAESRLYDFPAATATFTPSSTSQILIPQHRSRYILGGTTYLNFRVAVTGAVTVPQAGVSPALRFSPALFFGGGPTKSAAALIDRITVTAPNGQVLADIPNYAQWHNILLTHAASEDYIRTASITENAFGAATFVVGTNNDTAAAVGTFTSASSTLDIQLPLAVGLFSESKAFPLWALNGPLIIIIQWASVARSLGAVGLGVNTATVQAYSADADGTSPAITISTGLSYEGSQLTIRQRCVDVDIDYINQQRMLMMQGKVLTYNYRQTQNLLVQLNGTQNQISFNFGINVSSLLAVFGVNLMDQDCVGSAGTPVIASSLNQAAGSSTANVGSWGYSGNETKDIRVFRDGTQLSTFNLLTAGQDDFFTPLQEAMGILFSTGNSSIARRIVNSGKDNTPANQFLPNAIDNLRLAPGAGHKTTVSSTFPIPPAWQMDNYRGGSVYAPAAITWGYSTRMCNDANVANRGSQCSQLQVTATPGTTLPGYMYMYYVYSCAVSFDGTGNCVVRR